MQDTLSKGVIGRTKVLADLTQKGFEISLPVSESLSYDMIAHKDGKFLRVQARYITATDGTIRILFKNVHCNSSGSKNKAINKDLIDLFAIYCPDTDKCYYLNPKDYKTGCWLRLDKAQKEFKNIHYANQYLEPKI